MPMPTGPSPVISTVSLPAGANALRYVTSHRNYLARELMTWDDRIAYQWRVTISNMQVRSTYPTGPHPYHKLIWFRGWVGKSPNPNLTGCLDNRSTHT